MKLPVWDMFEAAFDIKKMGIRVLTGRYYIGAMKFV